MSFIKKIFGTAANETLGTVFKGIDSLTTTKEEKATLRMEAMKISMQDKDSARDMYKDDSIMQKVFAVFFLVIWGGLLYLLLRHFVFDNINLAEWQIAFINTIWGGVSMKLGTIIDFFFGGSHSQKDIVKK